MPDVQAVESHFKGPVTHTGDRHFARDWSIRQNSTANAFPRYPIRHFANCDDYEISFAIQCFAYMPISIVGKMPIFPRTVPYTVVGRR